MYCDKTVVYSALEKYSSLKRGCIQFHKRNQILQPKILRQYLMLCKRQVEVMGFELELFIYNNVAYNLRNLSNLSA